VLIFFYVPVRRYFYRDVLDGSYVDLHRRLKKGRKAPRIFIFGNDLNRKGEIKFSSAFHVYYSQPNCLGVRYGKGKSCSCYFCTSLSYYFLETSILHTLVYTSLLFSFPVKPHSYPIVVEFGFVRCNLQCPGYFSPHSLTHRNLLNYY